MTGRVVRERIDPRLTASLFANYRSATDALLELVDNAVDSRVPDRPLRVDIILRPGTISLTAVGGTGMGPVELERDYLRWGSSRKRAGERIGRFGQGGKAAIGHLGNRFSIVASRAGDERATGFEDDAYRDRRVLRTYQLREHPKPVEASLRYIRIEIGEVDRRADPRRLPARFAESTGRSRGGRAGADRQPGPGDAGRVGARRAPRLHGPGRRAPVRGWFGLLPDPAPPSVEPGLRISPSGPAGRLADWFGHPGPALHPALNRLVGEVELPHVPVTMNKSDVDRDSPSGSPPRPASTACWPRWSGAFPGGGLGRQPGALRTAEQVRRILARALRLLESGKLFESQIGTGPGSGDPDQLTVEGYANGERAGGEPGTEPEPPAGREAEAGEPEAPPVRSGGQSPGSRRGVGEIVIRALDPRLRSALVVEDGIRRVVINSRYPLYEVRKGDLWYQLETALREVCITIPEATVPEFERKVNELMLVSSRSPAAAAVPRGRPRSRRGLAG